MRRLLLIVALTLLTSTGGATAAQAVGGSSTQAAGYWGCVGSETLDQGVCLRNPVPERLPLPAIPRLPGL